MSLTPIKSTTMSFPVMVPIPEILNASLRGCHVKENRLNCAIHPGFLPKWQPIVPYRYAMRRAGHHARKPNNRTASDLFHAKVPANGNCRIASRCRRFDRGESVSVQIGRFPLTA